VATGTDGHVGDLRRETLLYGAAMVVGGLVQVAFLPFISRALTASQAGELGALRIVSEAVAGLVVLGLPVTLVRFWHSTDAHRSLLLRAMAIPLVPAAVTGVLLLLLGGRLSSVLRLGHPGYLVHSLLLGVAVAYVQVSLAIPRADGRAGSYLAFQVLRGVLSLALLALLLVAVRGFEPVPAFLVARWAPSIAVVVMVFALGWRMTRGPGRMPPPKGLTGDILGYSLPLVPVSLAMIVLTSADVFMLRSIYPDLSASGYYEWASRACLVLSPLTLGFGMAWQRFIFRKKHEGGQMSELGRSALLFMVLVDWAALVLAMVAPELTAAAGGAEWLAAAGVLPTLAGASAMYALFLVSQTGPLLTGQTRFIGGMTAFGAVLNIGFNLRLIPVAGALGAAFATLCTNLFMALSLFWLGRKVFPISFVAVVLTVIPPVLFGPLAHMAAGGRSIAVAASSVVTVLILAGLRRTGTRLEEIGG
jgi:O-antigen/teichoic acid export membrane protein